MGFGLQPHYILDTEPDNRRELYLGVCLFVVLCALMDQHKGVGQSGAQKLLLIIIFARITTRELTTEV